MSIAISFLYDKRQAIQSERNLYYHQNLISMFSSCLKVIDLDLVDTMSSKKDNEELRMQVKAQEMRNAAELTKWNTLIDEAIDEIASKI